MATVHTPQSLREFPLIFVKQSIALATAGFGVVVALAWNELIQATIATYITPFLGNSSGIVSMLIYAVVITTLAIVVTMQLLRLEARLETALTRPLNKKRGRPAKSAK